jgi:hypothetical protein
MKAAVAVGCFEATPTKVLALAIPHSFPDATSMPGHMLLLWVFLWLEPCGAFMV